jgi:hypothetical protein
LSQRYLDNCLGRGYTSSDTFLSFLFMSDMPDPATPVAEPIISKTGSWVRPYAIVMGAVAILVVALVVVNATQIQKNTKNNSQSSSSSSSNALSRTTAQKASDRLTRVLGVTPELTKKMNASSRFEPQRNSISAAPFTGYGAKFLPGAYGGGYSLISDEEAQKLDTTIAYRKHQLEVGIGMQKEKEMLGYTSVLYPFVGSYTTESWASTNYNKNIVTIGDTLMSAAITTPKSTTGYEGGKYALSQEFASPRYFSTLGVSGAGDERNFEVSFLSSLAADTSGLYKKVGTDTINGQAVDIYEMDVQGAQTFGMPGAMMPMPTKSAMPPDMVAPSAKSSFESTIDAQTSFFQSQKTRYFVNPESFELIRTERTAGGDLVERQTLVASEQLPPEQIASIFVLAPYNVEVKSFMEPEYSPSELSHLESIATQYSILYPSDTPEKTLQNSSAYLTSFVPDDEYTALVNSVEFNPNYVSYSSPTPGFENLFNTSVANTHVTGYATKPDKYQVGDYNSDATFVPFVITIDGVAVTAEKTVFPSNYTGGGEYLSLMWKNHWYVINQTPDFLNDKYNATIATPGVDSPVFSGQPPAAVLATKYSTMTPAQAKKIDTAKNIILTNNPRLVPASLSSLSPALRYLPGDLSVSMQMSATSLKAPVPNKKQRCDPSLAPLYTYSLLDCLAEHHGGFVLDFMPETNVVANTLRTLLPLPPTVYADSYAMTYGVVDSPITSLQLDKITLFQDYNQADTLSLGSLTTVADGITQVLIPGQSGSSSVAFYLKEIAGKTAAIALSQNYGAPLDSAVSLAKAKQIFDGVALDKDREALTKQMEQSFAGRVY